MHDARAHERIAENVLKRTGRVLVKRVDTHRARRLGRIIEHVFARRHDELDASQCERDVGRRVKASAVICNDDVGAQTIDHVVWTSHARRAAVDDGAHILGVLRRADLDAANVDDVPLGVNNRRVNKLKTCLKTIFI